MHYLKIRPNHQNQCEVEQQRQISLSLTYWSLDINHATWSRTLILARFNLVLPVLLEHTMPWLTGRYHSKKSFSFGIIHKKNKIVVIYKDSPINSLKSGNWKQVIA